MNPENSIRSRISTEKIESYFRAKESEKNDITVVEGNKNKETAPISLFFGGDKALGIFRVALNAEYTYQYEGYDDLPNSYVKQVTSLFNIGSEVHIFPSETFGIGVKYNRITTASNEDFEPMRNSPFVPKSIKENIRFNYLALSLLSRQSIVNQDHILYYSFSGGIIHYRDDGIQDGFPFFEEGETFGIALGIGYDYALHEKYGVGLTIEINLARVNSININGTTFSGVNFGISRLDFTAGFRFFK